MANMTTTALSVPAASGNVPGVGFQIFVKHAFSVVPSTGELLDLSAYYSNLILGGMPIKDTVGDGGYHMSVVSGASTASYLIQAYGMPSDATSGALVPAASAEFDLAAVDGQTWTYWGY